MNDQFDPYHIWLGIPPAEQPPNHYRLLGIQVGESNVEVIERAADGKALQLKTTQVGKRSDLSQRLLNEVAAAKVCLLNPGKKAAYDAVMAKKSATKENSALDVVKVASDIPQVAVSSAIPSSIKPARTRLDSQGKRKSANPIFEGAKIVVGGGAGLFFGVLMLSYFAGIDPLGWGKNSKKAPDNKVAIKSGTNQPTTPGTPPAAKATPATTDKASPPKVVPPVSAPVTPPKVEPPPPMVTPTSPASSSVAHEHAPIEAFAEPIIPLSPAEKSWQKIQDRPKNEIAPAAELSVAAKQALAEGHFELLLEIVRAVAPKTAGRKQRLEFLQGLQSHATEFVAQRALADAATVELSQALEAADAPAARDAAVIALPMARLANAPAQLRETALLASQVRDLEVMQREGPAAMKLVAAGDTSPLALRRAGEYACFLQGDWEHGLEWLKQCAESPWGELAKADLGGLDLEDQRQLGEQWWQQSGKSPLYYRTQLRARAAHWLRQSLSQTLLLALTMEPETIVHENDRILLEAACPSGHRCELKGGRPLLGKVGQGWYLNLGEYVATFVDQSQVESISAWMRIPRYEGTGDMFAGGTVTHGFSFTLQEGRAVRLVMGEGNGLEIGQYFSNGLVDHGWHHLVFVIDHTRHQWTYYVDGEQFARSPFTATAAFKENGLFLGGGNIGFLGALDEVAIFSHPLSAAEVQYLHHRGLDHESLPQTLGLPKTGP